MAEDPKVDMPRTRLRASKKRPTFLATGHPKIKHDCAGNQAAALVMPILGRPRLKSPSARWRRQLAEFRLRAPLRR